MNSRTRRLLELAGNQEIERTLKIEKQHQSTLQKEQKDTKTRLMKNSLTLQPPSFLMPWETSIYGVQNMTTVSLDALNNYFPLVENNSDKENDKHTSDNINTAFPNSKLDFVCASACSGATSNVVAAVLCKPLEKDLFLSDSNEEDPYASENDSNDPDFTPSSSKHSIRKIITSDSDSQSEEESPKKTRKRQRHSNQWKRNIIKHSRNHGEEYVSWKGNVHPKRQLRNACSNCRMKCSSKFSEEERNNIFENYWQLGDVNRQRDFIARHVEMIEKSRTRLREDNIDNTHLEEEDDQNKPDKIKRRNRNCSYKYSFQNKGMKVFVCKTFFLNTLSISAQVVKTVFAKLGSTGVVAPDRRGKVCKNSKLDDSVKQTVRDHINSFESIESHYCRKNTSKRFLPPTLSISKMYALYLEFCTEHNIASPSTESVYRQIFNTEFNISFFRPKKDLCDTCNRYKESSEEDKQKMEEEYQAHMKNKEAARELKNLDKERAKLNPQLCSAVFDLEQVLSVPKSNVGLAYYKLKLSTYNFTVFNLATTDCFCYMWYESIGRRGCSEIGSCLMRFIDHYVTQGVTEFSFYSDNCAGQNRNKFLFTMYNYLSQKYNIIIKHTYLEKGHTQSEGDSVHSVIEKASRHIPIYSPEQWYTLVRTAKKKQPYNVIEMDQEHFFDLKVLTQEIAINWDRDENNEKIYLNKIRRIETDHKFPNIILFSYNFDTNASFNKINLLQKGRRHLSIDVNAVQLKHCYQKTIPISKKKYDHLQFLCDKKVISPQYHHFFKNLPYSASDRGDSDCE